MKSIAVCLLLLMTSTCFAQQYGTPITADKALNSSELNGDYSDGVSEIKVKGKVEAVCQVKGCWMTMPYSNDQRMRITFKDYGFFVPTDCSGKTAVVQGQLKKETISVETLQHLAKDAGKSEEEIAAITEPKSELVLIADGVLLLD